MQNFTSKWFTALSRMQRKKVLAFLHHVRKDKTYNYASDAILGILRTLEDDHVDAFNERGYSDNEVVGGLDPDPIPTVWDRLRAS